VSSAPAPGGKLLALRRAPTADSELSDEALLAACAAGEPAALGVLFDRHQQPLHRFLQRMLIRDPSAVDDLVQQTFLEVWRSSPRYRPLASVRTWMMAIASNLVRHRYRAESRREHALTGLAAVAGLAAATRRPDDAAAQRQLLGQLGDALQQLPHELREVFVLCEIEEVPGVEVARALGLREGTVWRRLHDARKRLRAALQGGAR
jgi:RNA polymerase sigma factor (sigma-70 family)